MAKSISYSLTNFRASLHTQPAKIDAGGITLADMKNLRVDANGMLIPRYAVTQAKNLGDSPTGFAVARHGDHVVPIYLADNGDLGVIINNTPVDILLASDMTGRISADFIVKDVIVVTSEGSDQGYWIGLQNWPALEVHPLGIVPPVLSGATPTPGVGGSMAPSLYYYYRQTYQRSVNTVDPFNLAESNGSDVVEVLLGAGDSSVAWTDLPNSTDGQTTRKILWRSEGQASQLPAGAQLTEKYYLVAYLLADATTFLDQNADGVITANTQLRIDNTRVSSDVQNFAYYRDRVFAPAKEDMFFSDRRAGDPVWWAFPEDNALRVNAEKVFAVEWRGVLLFGGPDGIWRLVGDNVYNFEIDRISRIGPLDGFSWAKTKDFIAFVGINGLYACDGIRVESLHDVALRGFFDNMQTKKGAVVAFPSEEILFNVYVDLAAGGSASYQFLRQPDGAWEKWEDINISQGDWLVTTSLVDAEKTLDVYIIEDGENEVREILWDRPTIKQDTDLEGADDIVWSFKTQRLFWKTQGLGGQRKIFRWVEIIPTSTKTMTVEVWVDGSSVLSSSYSVARSVIAPFRVPIFSSGFDVQVEVSGTGDVGIESLWIVGAV